MTEFTEKILFTEFGVHVSITIRALDEIFKLKKLYAGTLPNIIQSGVISIQLFHDEVSPNIFSMDDASLRQCYGT
jgi:hypothetical protein